MSSETIIIKIVEQTPDGFKSLNSDGSASSLKIKTDKNVRTLKRNIRDLYGIPVDQYALYYKSSMLLGTTLVNVIENGTVLLRRSTVILIYYYHPTMHKNYKLSDLVYLNDTIERVKQRLISRSRDDNPAAYTIMFQQTPTDVLAKLEPGDITVEGAGIRDSGIVHLIRNV